MSRDLERLEHIIEAIDRIQKYSQYGKEKFISDELIQTWIVNHFQVIGEAARALSPAFRKQHADVPWKQIVGMRNIIVHDYFQIDGEIVWNAVENELPKLRARIAAIIEESKGASNP